MTKEEEKQSVEDLRKIREHFKGSDVDLAMTKWKVENKDVYFIFIPLLAHTSPQVGWQIINGQPFTFSYKLFEQDGRLIFGDMIDAKYYHLDTTDLPASKLHLVGDVGRVTLTREKFDQQGLVL